MGVSYHLVPVNRKTEKFENIFKVFGKRINNEINILGNFLIQFPKRFLTFFGKDEEYFDFIFNLKKEEVSSLVYEPAELKSKLSEVMDTLKTKNNFPIKQFYGFNYEGLRDSSALYVNLKGEELNRIVQDGDFVNDDAFDISTIFDMYNGYNETGNRENNQNPPTVYIWDENKNRTTKELNLDVFPTKIKIIKCEQNYGLNQEIKEVHLILKTPYEYFEQELRNLSDLCEECMKHDLGIKSYVSY